MSETKRYPAPKMVERKCKCCRKPFQARAADVKRGWGLFCSKSCKAIKQEQRTGQFAAHIRGGIARSDFDEFDPSWDSHKGVTFL